MSTFFSIVGFILIFACIGLYAAFFYKKFVIHKEEFSLVYLKKNLLYILLPVFGFILGMVFVGISYFTSKDVLNQLIEQDANFKFDLLNVSFIFVLLVLFGITLSVFLTSMFILLYVIEKEKSKRKLFYKITMFSCCLGAILFLYGAMELASVNLIYPLANRIIFCKEGVILANSSSKFYSDLMTRLGSSFKFEIAFYAIFIISGACLVLYVCDYKLFRLYGHHGLITTCFFIAFPCGILGARAWYVIGEWEDFASNPIRALYIWEGGLAIMGGAVFGIIAGILVMIIYKIKNERYKIIDYLLLVDIIVPTILLAQGIGRFGNFLNNEVHGNPINVNYFMWLPTFIRNNMIYSSVHSAPLSKEQIYVPLFFIEAVVNFSGYFFIEYGVKNLFGINYKLKHNYHADGSCVGCYIMWYGTTRAVLEPLRDSSFNMGSDGQFSNVSSYWMIGIGAFIIIVCIVLKILNEKKIITYQWQKYAMKLEKHNV